MKTLGIRRTALAVVSVAAAIGCASPAPETHQPIRFDHKRHMDVAKGNTVCTDCHPGAEREARAGLPSIQGCLLCHMKPQGNPPSDREHLVRKLANEPGVHFVQVTHNDRHVYFSHRAHVTLGKIGCAVCHGDVTKWTDAPKRPDERLKNMTHCLACHREKGAPGACSTCHR